MAELVIDRMGEKGDGLAGARIFARRLPGEKVDEAGRLIAASPERVQPFCPVFEACGGCKLQHWAQAPYAEWKRGLLVAALKARGLEPPVAPLIDAHGAGRRRVSLHVRNIEGRWQAGFMAEGSHALVPITSCPVLAPRLQPVPEVAASLGAFFGACDVAATLADAGLDLAVKAERKLADKAVAQFDGFMRAHGILRLAVNGETVAQLAPPSLTMGKASVPLPPGSFLQATAEGEAVLAALVVKGLGKSRQVADLFCGLGPFALRIAEARPCLALDSDKKAIAALNAALRGSQGLKPVKAEARDLFRNPLTPTELKDLDAVVLDPPRAGAEAQCRMLARAQVRRVIYVSCDVQSLARDAAILAAGGYALLEATPVDQFKYSAHLETVAVFERKRA